MNYLHVSSLINPDESHGQQLHALRLQQRNNKTDSWCASWARHKSHETCVEVCLHRNCAILNTDFQWLNCYLSLCVFMTHNKKYITQEWFTHDVFLSKNLFTDIISLFSCINILLWGPNLDFRSFVCIFICSRDNSCCIIRSEVVEQFPSELLTVSFK